MSGPAQNEIRLIYASRSRGDIALDQLISIQETSRHNNHRTGITGLLCHGNSRYLQVLEGDENAVRGLYETIARDPRHWNHHLLSSGPAGERLFGKWAMSCVQLGDSADQPVHAVVNEFFQEGPFLPETLEPTKSLDFLLAIAALKQGANQSF